MVLNTFDNNLGQNDGWWLTPRWCVLSPGKPCTQWSLSKTHTLMLYRKVLPTQLLDKAEPVWYPWSLPWKPSQTINQQWKPRLWSVFEDILNGSVWCLITSAPCLKKDRSYPHRPQRSGKQPSSNPYSGMVRPDSGKILVNNQQINGDPFTGNK